MVRPGVYQMQVRALCTAAASLFERGKHPNVEIMIPLVVDAEELRIARSWVRDVLDEIGHPELKSTVITVGAMIETPRAALTAERLAAHADFFSFGTNDLTQMTYAFSRDDVEARLLPAYQALGILEANPFAVLDQEGVGELVRIACEAARNAKPTIKLGVCGEHAGHPASSRLPRAPRHRLGELLAVPRADGPPRRGPSLAGVRPSADQRRGLHVRRRRSSAPDTATAGADAGRRAMPTSASTRRSCCTR